MSSPRSVTGPSSLRTAAIVVGVIAVLYMAREILIPFAFAITLTLILAPAVAWVQKMRLRRVPAVLVVMTVALALAGGISLVIFNQLVEVANELPNYSENIHDKLESLRMPGGEPSDVRQKACSSWPRRWPESKPCRPSLPQAVAVTLQRKQLRSR